MLDPGETSRGASTLAGDGGNISWICGGWDCKSQVNRPLKNMFLLFCLHFLLKDVKLKTPSLIPSL